MPTQIHVLGARLSEWLDSIQAISLQKARSFSRFQYLAMLQLEYLAYTLKTFWNIIEIKRNRQYSLYDRNGKREVAGESRNIQCWRGIAIANKYIEIKDIESLKFLLKSKEESQEIPKRLQSEKKESPGNPELVQCRRELAVANI